MDRGINSMLEKKLRSSSIPAGGAGAENSKEQGEESRAYLAWEHENSHGVESFEIVGPYTLRLKFDDGIVKVIDFHDYLFRQGVKEWESRLRDLDFFNQVFVDDCGVLSWPNRYDFNPAMLYTWDGDSWRGWVHE
jgi:hypothetical protein